jgi:hypothetical protein
MGHCRFEFADVIPTHFEHKTPVSGLTPAFADVDLFYSRQVIQNRVAEGKLRTALVRNAGAARQDRNWFWYHRTFEVDEECSLAIDFQVPQTTGKFLVEVIAE